MIPGSHHLQGVAGAVPPLDALDGRHVARQGSADGQRPRTFINRTAGLRQVQLLPAAAAP